MELNNFDKLTRRRMEDIKYVKCPVCGGNPRRYLSYVECMRNCVFYGSYEECTNCKDGYVVEEDL